MRSKSIPGPARAASQDPKSALRPGRRRLLKAGAGLLFIAGAAPSRSAGEQETLRIATFVGALHDVNRADMETSLNVWGDELAQQMKIPLTIRLYDRMEDIRRDYEQGRVNFFIADGIALLHHFRISELSDGFMGTRPGKPGASLIVRKDSNIKSFKDVAGKRVVLLRNHEYSDLVMDTLSLRELGKSFESLGCPVQREKNNQQLILKLFFDKADAALVWSNTFDLAAEMNPQISQKLTAIYSIPQHPGAAAVFSDKVTPSFRNYVIDRASGFNQYTRGKQILEAMQLNGLQRFPRTELEAIDQLMKEHASLQTRYKRKRG